MKPQECKQRDLLNFNRQLEYHQLQQRGIKTFKRKNEPRSAVEDRPNRFSRRSLTVRILILVYILVVCFVKYVCYLCTSLRGEVSFLPTWLLTFYEVVRVAFQLRIWFVNYATDKRRELLCKRQVKAMQDRNNCSLRTVLVMRSQSTRLLAVRNLCSLHISTDSWVLSHAFGMERDYYAAPFKPRFIGQSLCKCDRSLPLESIRKKSTYFECFFFFLQQITGVFFALLGVEG